MEGAGKLIDDDELREAMQEKGLGTPATRAAIIEGLIYEKYIHREGRELVPGAKAFQLMTLLRGLGVEDLTKPELTGNWEYQLAEMEKGHLERETFMRRDRGDGRAHRAQGQGVRPRHHPRRLRDAGRAVPELRRRGQGELPPLRLHRHPGQDRAAAASRSARSPAAARSSCAEVEAFLRDKRIGPLEGFRSKAGWPFTAELRLVRDDELKNWKLEFDFGEDAKREGESGEPVDFSEQESLGICPKTQGKVYEFGTSYVCEHAVGANVICDFKSGKVILQQPVAREQMTKLLATGATDLLEGFVSNKTRRKFKARLAWDAKEGKVVFAFEPRPGRPPAKRAGRRRGGGQAGAGEEGCAATAAAEAPAAQEGAGEDRGDEKTHGQEDGGEEERAERRIRETPSGR